MVAGVVSDLSGDAGDPVEYGKRNFVEVEPGGVDKLMRRLGPKLEFTVSDELSAEDEREIPVSLQFNSLDDFSPMGIAAQVPQTAKLLKARQRLADLYGKLEANDKLDGILGEVLANTDKREQLRSELAMSEGEGKGDS